MSLASMIRTWTSPPRISRYHRERRIIDAVLCESQPSASPTYHVMYRPIIQTYIPWSFSLKTLPMIKKVRQLCGTTFHLYLSISRIYASSIANPYLSYTLTLIDLIEMRVNVVDLSQRSSLHLLSRSHNTLLRHGCTRIVG